MRLTELMSAGSVWKSDTPEVAVSAELFAPVANGVDLCYQTFGDPDSDPLLLVMGLGGPMTWWDPAFCRLLASRGFYVIRYDNRDTGRSTKVPGRVSRAMLVRAFSGQRVRPPYSMRDLAQDACSLLDHLGLEAAHLVGVSMGGMIAQTVAIEHPRTGAVAHQHLLDHRQALGGVAAPPPAAGADLPPRSRPVGVREGQPGDLDDDQLAGLPVREDEVLARAEETFDRGWSAGGVLRQMLAVLTQENRGPRLHALRIPALVVHGTADRMVHPSGGRATAAAIPGAELLLIDGLGHDLPVDLYDTFVDAIRRTADRA